MASFYDFKFDAVQDIPEVAGAGGILLVCQVCKQIDPNPEPISVPAGNASVIREAVRTHVHQALGQSVTQAVRESQGRPHLVHGDWRP